MKCTTKSNSLLSRQLTPSQHKRPRTYQIEFEDYQKQLEVIMQSEYNGAALFSSTILCGGRKEVNIEELNMLRSTWDHAVKTQKVDLGSPAGTISFRVNSGGDGDIYRIWMGDNLVFSMGGYNPDMKSQGAHHSSQQDAKDNSQDLSWDIPGTLANGKAGNGAGGDRWRTTGSAGNGNDDRVEVTFGPGQPTTFKLYLGDGNDPSLNDFSGAVSSGVAGKLYKPRNYSIRIRIPPRVSLPEMAMVIFLPPTLAGVTRMAKDGIGKEMHLRNPFTTPVCLNQSLRMTYQKVSMKKPCTFKSKQAP